MLEHLCEFIYSFYFDLYLSDTSKVTLVLNLNRFHFEHQFQFHLSFILTLETGTRFELDNLILDSKMFRIFIITFCLCGALEVWAGDFEEKIMSIENGE